jgi:hypothetical protein
MTVKKLILKQEQINENEWQYRVLQATNFTSPKINTVLSEDSAKRYCLSNDWSVTIKGE